MGSGASTKRLKDLETFEYHPALTEEERKHIVTCVRDRTSTVGKGKNTKYSVTFKVGLKRYRGIVLFQHGIYEHAKRYRHLFHKLAHKGFFVFALDYLSHGLSDDLDENRKKGDRPSGYLSIYTAVDDVVALSKEAFECVASVVANDPHPYQPDMIERKLFLIGQSFGGAVSTLTLLKLVQEKSEKFEIGGLILTSSAVMGPLPLYQRVAQPLLPILTKYIPKMRLVDAADPCSMSRDKSEAVRYLKDPLNSPGNLSLYTANEVMRGLREIKTRVSEIKVPLLVLHGELDKVCDLNSMKALVGEMNSKDKTFVVMPGFWHTMFHDSQWRDVAKKITDWLDKHDDDIM